MIRKILIALGCLIAVALVSLIVFIQTVDVNKFLPQLTQQVGHAIGRKVTIERAGLHLSLFQGVSGDVEGISVSEDKSFSDQPFLRVGSVHCGVNLAELLIKQKIAVSSIEIRSPRITVIKNKAGKFNFESMIPAPTEKSGGSTAKTEKDSAQKMNNVSLPVLLVNSFKVEGAALTYIDRSASPALDLTVSKVDAQVNSFSLTEPFGVKLDAAVLSRGQNVHVNGTGRLDLRLQQARFDDVHFDADLAQIDLDQLNKVVPTLEQVGLQPGLRGKVQIVASQAVLGASGILVLSVEGQLSDGHVATKMLAQPVEKLSVQFDANESRVRVKEFSLSLASGRIQGQANIKDYLTTQQFDMKADIQQLPLGDILEQKNLPTQIKGSLSGDVQLSGRGFTPEAMDKMTGQSNFSVADGELVNMNLIKTVLDRITIIPGLGQALENQLPANLQDKISGKSTKIDKADVKTRIENSTVVVDDAQLQAQGFTLGAHGDVGFNQSVNMAAELVLSKELAESLASSSKEMKVLMDEEGQIRIPVKISGKITSPSVLPDINYLSKRLIVNEGGTQLQKVIDKNPEVKKILNIFMGGKEEPAAGQEQNDPAQTNSTSQPGDNNGNSAQDLLNNLFKKGL